MKTRRLALFLGLTYLLSACSPASTPTSTTTPPPPSSTTAPTSTSMEIATQSPSATASQVAQPSKSASLAPTATPTNEPTTTAEVELPEWVPLSEEDNTWAFHVTLGEIVVPETPPIINGVEILAWANGFTVDDGNINTEDRQIDKKIVLGLQLKNESGENVIFLMSTLPTIGGVKINKVTMETFLDMLHFTTGKAILTRFGYSNDINDDWIITQGYGSEAINAQLGLQEFAETGQIDNLGIDDFFIPLAMYPNP